GELLSGHAFGVTASWSGRFIVTLLALLSVSSAFGVTFRWSETSYRIYVTGPGSATLSDVKAGMPNAKLTQVTPGVWHLRANLVMENGARLVLHGTKIGGDVNELRLQSNNTGEPNSFVYVSADWGSIDIRSTSITSWDDAVNGPDTESGALRRAFIRVRSSLDSDGVTPRESRMDILDSDIGYLGSHDAEAYGLVWKVIESPVSSYGALTNLYNLVNVYGDIIHSRVHHNYFGHYSFGSFGQRLADNEMDHNVGYGFDPHDDSDYLVIENNNVHHNGWHGIIASQRCNNTIIRNNTSWSNGRNGIMLHRYCNDSLIENNRCFHNGDSGVALFDNARTIVRGNICLQNFNAGIRMSVGSQDNLIENNEFANGANYGLYLYQGGDLPFPGDDGHPKRNRFINNRIHHNANVGLFLTTGDDNLFAGNIFEANYGSLVLENGKRNRFESNAIPREAVVRTTGAPDFLASTIARNQPALSIQLDPFSTMIFEDTAGRVFATEESGLATTAGLNTSVLTLASPQIGAASYVQLRNLSVKPDAGTVAVTVMTWNIAGSLNKRWLAQASPTTRRITYKIGDLTPNTDYVLLRNGIEIKYTADGAGTISFSETAVTTALVDFHLALTFDTP
ncbi:MAG TPA: right-handed parallel beta-helix repeat-containing protein, partial [Verrucomicrobiae bacterium]